MDSPSSVTPVPYLLSVLAMLFTALPAQAQDQGQDQTNPWYEVEVVVFKHTDAADTELWPDDPGSPDLTHTMELNPPSASPALDREALDLFSGSGQDQAFVDFLTGDGTQGPAAPMAFRLLPDSEDQLGDVITRLNASGDYQVLYHAAWRQPAYNPDNSVPVHLHYDPLGVQTRMLSSVDQYLAQAAAEQTEDGGTATTMTLPPSMPPSFPLSDDASTPPVPSWLLNGDIGLAQSRYLHLDIDLVYQVTTPADQSQEEPAIGETMIVHTYRLQQSRRIRSDNLYYFDHPRFGVLAKVTPFTPPPSQPPAGKDSNTGHDLQVPGQ